MPHVTIQYTANLEAEANMDALCATLCEVLGAQRAADGKALFPIGGTRVLAYPAPHHAVADGQPDRAFVFVLARIAPGRERARVQAAGEAMLAAVQAHFATIFDKTAVGITVQVEEQQAVYDAKHSRLHAMFAAEG